MLDIGRTRRWRTGLGLFSGVALSVVAAGGAQGPTLQTGVQATYDYLARRNGGGRRTLASGGRQPPFTP